MKVQKLHEPISLYGSGVYNSLITVVQAFPLAVLLWVVVEKPDQGPSLLERITTPVSALEFLQIPYALLLKLVMAFVGIIAIWHSYITNDQFHAYRLTRLDSVIPFTFCFFESCVIVAIRSESTVWFAFWILAISALGILAYSNMKHQMFVCHSLDLFKDHFEDKGERYYGAVIKFCEQNIVILWQSSVIMFVVILVSNFIGPTVLNRAYHLDLILVSAAYFVSLARLAKYDVESFLIRFDPPSTSQSYVRSVEVDGLVISMTIREFLPSDPSRPSTEALVLLPGWSAGDSPTLSDLALAFAEAGGTKSLCIQTRSNAYSSLFDDAKAIKQYLRDSGLNRVTIAAHSEGCIKAALIIEGLQQEDPQIAVDGVILLAPVGIYDMSPGGLIS